VVGVALGLVVGVGLALVLGVVLVVVVEVGVVLGVVVVVALVVAVALGLVLVVGAGVELKTGLEGSEINRGGGNMKLSDVDSWPAHKGKRELMKHMRGDLLSYKEAVMGKCYDCNVGWVDGAEDCKVPDCPLYGFMAYRDEKPDRPKRGTEEQRKAAGDRLRVMAKSKQPV
jgi:hypothetical protein